MAFGHVKFSLAFLAEDKITGVVEKAQRGLGDLGKRGKKAAKQAQTAFGQLQVELESITAKAAVVGTAFSGLQNIAGAVAGAVREAFEFIERGELARQLDDRFQQFTQNSVQSLEELREATGGLIDDKEIKSNVIRMKLFGSGMDEIKATLKLAGEVARLTGEDFQGMANRFSDAVATGSAESLKVFGVNVDLAASVEAYASKTGRLVSELTQQEIATARLQAISVNFHGNMAEMGASLDGYQSSVGEVSNRWAEFSDRIAVKASKAFDEIAFSMGLLERTDSIQKLSADLFDLAVKARLANQFLIGDGNISRAIDPAKALAAQMKLGSEATRELIDDLQRVFSEQMEMDDFQQKWLARYTKGLELERQKTIELNRAKKAQADREVELHKERQKNVEQSKRVLAWTEKLIEASTKEQKARQGAASARAKALRSELENLARGNRLLEMEIAGVDRLVIAKQKEAHAIEDAERMSAKSDLSRAVRQEQIRAARLAYQKERDSAIADEIKAAEEKAKRDADAARRQGEALAKLREDFETLQLEKERERLDALSVSMMNFGGHVEGAAMSVSAQAPAIAAGFGMVGATVGIMGDNLDDLAAGVPKSLSAIGAIAASTTESTKAQAAVQSAFEFASSIAAGARLDFWGASQHFLAGTLFAAVAGGAGGSKRSAGASSAGRLGGGGVGAGGTGGGGLSTSMGSSVTVNVAGLMSGTSADLGVAIGESLSGVQSTGLGSRSV